MFFGISVAKAQVGQAPEVVQGEYIVKYKNSTGANVRSQRSKLAAKSTMRKAYPEMGMYHVSVKAGAANSVANIEDLKNDPEVEFVEPNYRWYKSGVADPSASAGIALSSYSYQEIITNRDAFADNGFYQNNLGSDVQRSWGLESSIAAKGKVIVAVVDTGLDSSHILFHPTANGGAGALWVNAAEAAGLPGVDDDQNGFVDDVNGWNFNNNSANFFDDESHGTHVAGIIVGAGQNIFARPLQESKIQIMPLKFLGIDGSGTTSSAINAIYYAVNKGAQVINNSWGGPTYSRALHEALTYAYSNAVLVVSASGNYRSNNDSTPMYPANYDVPSNISVASSSTYDVLSGFSNYGRTSVQIASPGEYVLSSVPGNRYAYMSGTSMAAPFVSGIAAMAWRENSALTGYQIKQMLISSVDVIPALSAYVSSNGRVNTYNLVGTALGSAGSNTSSFQPNYSAQYRTPASDTTSSPSTSAGGCGLITNVIHEGPGRGGPNPTGGVVGGLMLLPMIVWFALRRRSHKDHRSHERFQLNSEIRVKMGDREIVGSMRSISLGGVSFSTDQALENGGIVTMQIASPDGREKIEVQGQIVWNSSNQAYGVKFANARKGTLAMIHQWVQTFGTPSKN
jgi:subtilisin family serine protease